MSKSKQEVKMEMLLAENRIVIDGIARRLFMVQEPVELKVSGIPEGVREGQAQAPSFK